MIAKIDKYNIQGVQFIVFDGEVYTREYPLEGADEVPVLNEVPEPAPTEESAPVEQKQRGRKPKVVERKTRACSVCGKPGHNATTCTNRRKFPPDVFDEEDEDAGPQPNSTKEQMRKLIQQDCSFDEIIMSFPNVSMVVLREMYNELTA